MQTETRTGLLPLLRSDSAMSAVSVIQADDVVVVLSDFVIGCNQQIPEADGKRWGLVPTGRNADAKSREAFRPRL